jgi:hypothetical protein
LALNLADKSGIMAELWMNYRDDKNFSDFFGYNDIGLPMSYYLAEGLITELSPLGEQYIMESCDMFLAMLEVTEDDVDSLIDISLDAVLKLSMEKKEQPNPEV